MRRIMRNIYIGLFIPLRGIFRIVSPSKEVCVLFYHSISESQDPFSISPIDFEKQLMLLRHVANPVSLSDIVSYVKGDKDLPDGSVAVTFDDGYQDIVTTALPILHRYRIPATVFVSVDPLKNELGNAHELLTHDDIRHLSQDPLIEIGSHAITHKKLTRLADHEVRFELQQSKDKIESITGKPCRYIAYPKGSVNPKVRFLTQNAKYVAGVCIKQGMVYPNMDPFLIKRIVVQKGIGAFAFRWRMTRIMDWLAVFDTTLQKLWRR